MGQHVHLFQPGDPVTFTASADVTGGQLVVVTGNRTVGPAGANTVAWVGTAAFDAKAGDKVTVLKGGVQKIVASGAIAAGALVVAAAAGKVSALAAVTTPTPADVTNSRAIVGIALTGGTDVPVEIDFTR
ncbi:capsid cement protein [Paenarthrobacter sp. TA1.8]|uniref:capsid cement protein n=1 Tax=Paenarthrobacter sp. TA1.8 TaxID=3400219 RepID=UPI003B43921F